MSLNQTELTEFVNDLPENTREGELHMYAIDTTVYCVGENIMEAIARKNIITKKRNEWCV